MPLTAEVIKPVITKEEIRQQMIAYALRWVGTPYEHLGRQVGVRGDCISALVDVAAHFGVADNPRQSIGVNQYSRVPNPRVMRECIEQHMNPIHKKDAIPGDWFHIAWRIHPQHMALYTHNKYNNIFVLHASSFTMKYVLEQMDSELWSQIVTAYRFKLLCN